MIMMLSKSQENLKDILYATKTSEPSIYLSTYVSKFIIISQQANAGVLLQGLINRHMTILKL